MKHPGGPGVAGHLRKKGKTAPKGPVLQTFDETRHFTPGVGEPRRGLRKAFGRPGDLLEFVSPGVPSIKGHETMREKKILVVDDEVFVRQMLHKAFTKSGYEVTLAEDAEAALDVLTRENIQVMFLDLNLPGMNGLELCRTIRKDNPLAIIYAVTGYASLFELAECREAAFDDYFTKPVNLELLYHAADDAFTKIKRWKSK